MPDLTALQRICSLLYRREIDRTGFLALLWDQLNNYLVIILIVAAVVSLALGEVVDSIAIMVIVALNAVVGVIQESKAEQALAALKKMSAPNAQVIRDGHVVSVPRRELVGGDIVLLEAGNYVPADVRLVESFNLKVEEASLTGESVPVVKNAAVVLDAEIPLGDRRNTALMVELEQIKAETKPVEVLFVADAMTGQDAVRSAEVFHERVGITGVVLTKMDGDARGGAALSIKQVIGQPVKFVGVGEKYDAIEPFYPDRISPSGYWAWAMFCR